MRGIQTVLKSSVVELLLSPCFWTQSAGKIVGVVKDPTGAVLLEASVIVSNPSTGHEAEHFD